jgi:ubiquinone/menaquinone biosynthesis C-methylase UbiE
MTSDALLELIRCPDCRSAIVRRDAGLACTGCGRVFDQSRGFLDLRPLEVFREQTKYLDDALHADARHESVSPPLLGSKIRQDMLRRLLAPGPGDRVIDLGCGSGRSLVWQAGSGASMAGIDISPFFSHEALDRCDLILGDLRRLPFSDGVFTKAWTLDVMEHLSPETLRDVLAEANRVLAPGGALFAYSHVRKNGWPAAGVRLVNRFSGLLHRLKLIDLRQEWLRKSDHVNPLADHEELRHVMAAAGFTIERIVYYTPLIGSFIENVLMRLGERLLTRQAARRQSAGDAPVDDAAAVREARSTAKARVSQGGIVYQTLRGLSALMTLDVLLFGRIQSGPFFVLVRKSGNSR